MRPLPYTSTAAGIAFYAVFVTFALLEFRVRVRSAINPQGSRADQGSLLVVYILIVAGMGSGFSLAARVHSAEISFARWPIFIAGIALMCLGVAIRQWAVALLGEYFTIEVRVHAGQAVVDKGPYRYVRHPSYTGLLVTLLGMGLALGNWAGLLALVVVPSAAVLYRINVEERALLTGIGEPYRRYAAGRSRLIPRVW